jgi:acyl-coenzyme A thioesterase PaaI-like protein
MATPRSRTYRWEDPLTVLHTGSRVATGEARILDASDKLYAHGTSTCLILR